MYVVDYLRSRRVWFETFLHRPASSATRLAGRVHIPGRSVAKTVLVKARGAYLLTVLPATSRVDLARLGHALGLDPGEVKLAAADEIERIFHDCEPGTIPPFGRLYELRTVADVSLQDAGVLVFRTNTRHLGIRMQFRDYESLEEPFRADFARPISSGPGQSLRRRVTTGQAGKRAGVICTERGRIESTLRSGFARRVQCELIPPAVSVSASLSSSGAKPRRIVFSVMLRVRRNSRR